MENDGHCSIKVARRWYDDHLYSFLHYKGWDMLLFLPQPWTRRSGAGWSNELLRFWHRFPNPDEKIDGFCSEARSDADPVPATPVRDWGGQEITGERELLGHLALENSGRGRISGERFEGAVKMGSRNHEHGGSCTLESAELDRALALQPHAIQKRL